MKRLYRSTTDVKIAGICGGVAEEWQVDPGIIRLAAVFAVLVTGIFPLVITYIIAWIILPKGRPPTQP